MWHPGIAGLNNRPIVIVAMLGMIGVEIVWRTVVQHRGYDAKAAAASIGVAVGHAISGVFNGAIVTSAYLLLWKLTPFHLPVRDWRTWAVGFIAVEFCYYWFHRSSHTIRWLWASHAVHHSAEELTLPAAVRLGWTSTLSGGWLIFAPLVILGWHPTVIAVLLALNLLYQFLLHTETVGRLGILERVFNTPSHHRVHHASNPQYIDRNFGGVLIVFDRWFGTFAEELPQEPCRYGLAKPLHSYNPIRLALQEWLDMIRDVRRAGSLTAALHALFGPPSLSPQPADKTFTSPLHQINRSTLS